MSLNRNESRPAVDAASLPVGSIPGGTIPFSILGQTSGDVNQALRAAYCLILSWPRPQQEPGIAYDNVNCVQETIGDCND